MDTEKQMEIAKQKEIARRMEIAWNTGFFISLAAGISIFFSLPGFLQADPIVRGWTADLHWPMWLRTRLLDWPTSGILAGIMAYIFTGESHNDAEARTMCLIMFFAGALSRYFLGISGFIAFAAAVGLFSVSGYLNDMMSWRKKAWLFWICLSSCVLGYGLFYGWFYGFIIALPIAIIGAIIVPAGQKAMLLAKTSIAAIASLLFPKNRNPKSNARDVSGDSRIKAEDLYRIPEDEIESEAVGGARGYKDDEDTSLNDDLHRLGLDKKPD